MGKFGSWFNRLGVTSKLTLVGIVTTFIGAVVGSIAGSPTISTLVEINATKSKEIELTSYVNNTQIAAARTTRTATPIKPSATPTPTITPGPSPTFLPTHFYDQPIFDITFLSAFPQMDTLEVTNGMISRRNELTEPGNKYQVSQASFEFEIHPNYYGERSYGNVALRITGNTGQPILKDLWSDFSKESATQLVTVSLTELFTICNLSYLDDIPETNLHIGEKRFPSVNITIEVIRLSDPQNPFPGTKKIKVVNTPWIQNVRMGRRNGHRYIDYYVQNFGQPGYFGYNANLTRTIRPVTESSQAVWSGTESVVSGQNSPLIYLDTGEVYQESILVNDDLPQGRYIFQIYTYKVQPHVKFDSAVDWTKYLDAWVFSNTGDQMIFITCAEPGKSCPQSAFEPIEFHRTKVITFDSQRQHENGSIKIEIESFLLHDHVTNQYTATYSIDPLKSGWAGILVYFQNPVDFSMYRYLRFNLKFGDVVSPIYMQIFSTDPDTKEIRSSLIRLGEPFFGKSITEEQTITIPLIDLSNIDLKSVSRISFFSDNELVPDNLEHQFTVGHIEFVDTTPK